MRPGEIKLLKRIEKLELQVTNLADNEQSLSEAVKQSLADIKTMMEVEVGRMVLEFLGAIQAEEPAAREPVDVSAGCES